MRFHDLRGQFAKPPRQSAFDIERIRAGKIKVQVRHGDSPSGPAGDTNARRAQISKRLLERTQVDFLRPGRRSLPMDLPVSLGDGVNVEEPILAALLDRFRSPAAQTLTVDSPIDDDMRDVDAVRAILSRHALRDHSQPGFRRGELRKARLAAKAGGAPVKITVPRPSGTSRRAASRPTRNPPKQPTRQSSSNSSAEISRKSIRRLLPALNTTRSAGSRPAGGDTARSNSRTTSASRVVSVGTASALPPVSMIDRTTCSIFSGVRPATRTWYPSAAKRRQSAAPRPRWAPTPMTIALGVLMISPPCGRTNQRISSVFSLRATLARHTSPCTAVTLRPISLIAAASSRSRRPVIKT